MNHTFQELMSAATRLTQSGRLQDATAAIQHALRGAAMHPAHADAATPYAAPSAPRSTAPTAQPKAAPLVLDGCVFEVKEAKEARAPVAKEPGTRTGTPTGTSEFTWGTHTHAGLTRRFKLYSPPNPSGRALPLVVMLHGCTQNPDDFAAGTAMNERAREQGFFVLYPEQAQDANPSRCWNWFKHNHQKRGSGEPALLASLTQTVIQQHSIDPRRVFIAGLSAGGAMAAIVAAAYPEIYAAVGVHSGLPSGSARNVGEALMVMKTGSVGIVMPAQAQHGGHARATTLKPKIAVPTIVFHGDQDQTVHPSNGEQVIADALSGMDSSQPPGAARPRVEQGVSAQGRRYTRSTHQGSHGQAIAEHWLVHGAGHAWSGGQAQGSYTDAKGPDATQEMLRFFFGQVA